MFKGRVVFVLGAGASADLKMPVGRRLAEKIREKSGYRFDDHGNFRGGDRPLFDCARRRHGIDQLELMEVARRLHNGLDYSFSIDDFLDSHQEHSLTVKFGKASIVRTILQSESESSLYVDPAFRSASLDSGELTRSWLPIMMRIASRGVRTENATSLLQNVTFINFNYDRCLEQFLIHSIMGRFSLDLDRAVEVAQSIRIFHPYGTTGTLWRGDRNFVAYGDDGRDYFELAEEIQTYAEKLDDTGELEEMRRTIREADRIIFLGFAFHHQNMALLRTEGTGPTMKTILASAFECSDPDVDEFRSRVQSLFPDNSLASEIASNARFRDVECRAFVEEYAAFLTA